MHAQNLETPPIQVCPKSQWDAALNLLYRTALREDRNRHVAWALDEARRGNLSLDGLFVAIEGGRLVGTCFARVEPGRAGIVVPPQVVDDAGDPRLALRLMETAIEFFSERPVRVAQALLPAESGPDHALLQKAGFERVAQLLYLASQKLRGADVIPDAGLEFLPANSVGDNRLAQVIEQTYTDTRDCPQLNGVRDIHDVIAGYRATGRHNPERWFIIGRDGQDIGCLILTEFPESRQWELIYMGIIPDLRGQGLGLRIVRYAQQQALEAGADRLVLAVDADNAPAINMYAAAGFSLWEKRTVFLKVFAN